MKKFTLYLLVASMLFSAVFFCACSNDSEKEPSSPQNKNSSNVLSSSEANPSSKAESSFKTTPASSGPSVKDSSLPIGDSSASLPTSPSLKPTAPSGSSSAVLPSSPALSSPSQLPSSGATGAPSVSSPAASETPSPSPSSESPTPASKTPSANSSPDIPSPGVIELSGSFTSDTGTKLNLWVDYTVSTSENEEYTVTVTVYLDSYSLYCSTRTNVNTVKIGSNAYVYSTPALSYDANTGKHHTQFATFSAVYTKETLPSSLTLSATWQFNGTYSKIPIDTIFASTTVELYPTED